MAYAVSPSSRATPPAQSLHSEPGEGRGGREPDDADLPGLTALVERGGRVERVVGRLTRGQAAEQLVEVGDAGEGLRRDGPDAEPGSRDDGADGEELARDGDAVGVTLSGDDREGHGGQA